MNALESLCQCQSGFTGKFCTLPSTDGVCPVDRRRWCYRGVCLWEDGHAKCLCPPGWLGQQCENKDEKFEEEMKSIEFNGENSLLAFSLNSTKNEGEMGENDGFMIEFRLNPSISPFNQEQLLVALMREQDAQVLAGVTMLPQNDLQQSSPSTTKRPSLIKKLRPQNSMLIRLEKLGTDEVGLLVDGRPKGTWKLPSLKYPEQSSGIFLLLGGLLPQQRSKEYKNSVQLDEVLPFYGCLSELSVNGNLLELKDLINKKDSIAVNLNKCQAKTEEGKVEEKEEEEREEKEEGREEKEDEEDYATSTTSTPSTTPTYIPVVTDVTEDPLLEVKDVGYREQEVKSAEDKYEPEFVEASVEPSHPGIMPDTLSPDPLPTVIKKTQTPEAIYSTIQMDEESTLSPLLEESEEDEDELTTLMPAPSVILLPSNIEMSKDKTSTDKTSVDKTSEDRTSSDKTSTDKSSRDEMSGVERSKYTMPHIETSTDQMPATIIYTTEGKPLVTVDHQKQTLEGLEQKIFRGLCDQKTCGIHGSCEEINSTHVTCHCRDFWAGQECEEFQPLEYAAGFDGSAFVVFSSEEFPHMISDLEEVIQFKLRTRARYGLIFWQGQHPSLDRREGTEQFGEDFLAISLLGGHLSFTYELGGGAAQLISKRPVNDGKTHLIRATRRGRNGTLQINRGKVVEGRSSGILAMLNVEGNIFIGGVPDLNIMTAGMFNQNFVGCLGEVELNGQRIDLMANAIDGRNVRPCGGWKSKIGSKGRRKRLLRRLRRRNRG
ncbi:unnamed protein product [Meloidogyne enterolobii]|uniref:Uncharacterized protein n=1 Tax=Meloidogyne enterolobii TaxID=390850 RepID=A0ACB1B5T8_MELEN